MASDIDGKRIFIAGGAGMLGEAFYQCFRHDFDLKVTDKNVNVSWVSFLDFRDAANYREQVLEYRPDLLFHLGAHTDLEYCELNAADAYATNTTAVENAIKVSNELGIPLLYISSAGIFDGGKDVYDEEDTPNPLGHYARSKYLGERMVMEQKDRYLICRAGWMMGGGPGRDKKFIGKIMKQIGAGRTSLDIVSDKFGTPTYTHDFALTVKKLFENKAWGLYNMACSGVTDRVEIAREILLTLGKQHEISINTVSSDFFRKEYFAARPTSERLVNRKLAESGFNSMREWKICLREYLERDFRDYFA